eukprot:6077857-Pleurochrysis_carterae.AAC.1
MSIEYSLCPAARLVARMPFPRQHRPYVSPLLLGTLIEYGVPLQWRYESRHGSAVRTLRLGNTNRLRESKSTKRSQQVRKTKLKFVDASQKLSNTIGSFPECVDPLSAKQVLTQLEEQSLVENLGEAVGHLVARADKVRFGSAVELALA